MRKSKNKKHLFLAKKPENAKNILDEKRRLRVEEKCWNGKSEKYQV